jgi:hypothetical protein
MNRNKKMKEVTEAVIVVYPAPRKALFFPGLAPPAPLRGARPGRSGAGRTGNVGVHQNIYPAPYHRCGVYLKESLVFQHGVRGL